MARRLASSRGRGPHYVRLRAPSGATAAARRAPAPLTVDRVDGDAWVSLVVLRTTRLTDAAGRDFLGWPFAQINARTYVRLGEERGVRFLGVSCASWRMAVAAAALAHLPYRRARVDHSAFAGEHHLQVEGPHGRVALRWRAEDGDPGRDPLADRYFSVAGPANRLWRGDLIHAPWPLQPARVEIADNQMLAALGLPTLDPRRPDRVIASPGTVAITPPSYRLAPANPADGGGLRTPRPPAASTSARRSSR